MTVTNSSHHSPLLRFIFILLSCLAITHVVVVDVVVIVVVVVVLIPRTTKTREGKRNERIPWFLSIRVWFCQNLVCPHRQNKNIDASKGINPTRFYRFLFWNLFLVGNVLVNFSTEWPWWCSSGQVVSVVGFYFDDLSSNPTKKFSTSLLLSCLKTRCVLNTITGLPVVVDKLSVYN